MNCADCEHSLAHALFLWCGNKVVEKRGVAGSGVPCIPVCPANEVPAWCPEKWDIEEEETLYVTKSDETNVTTSIEGLEPIRELPSGGYYNISEIVRKLNRLMEITNRKVGI